MNTRTSSPAASGARASITSGCRGARYTITAQTAAYGNTVSANCHTAFLPLGRANGATTMYQSGLVGVCVRRIPAAGETVGFIALPFPVAETKRYGPPVRAPRPARFMIPERASLTLFNWERPAGSRSETPRVPGEPPDKPTLRRSEQAERPRGGREGHTARARPVPADTRAVPRARHIGPHAVAAVVTARRPQTVWQNRHRRPPATFERPVEDDTSHEGCAHIPGGEPCHATRMPGYDPRETGLLTVRGSLLEI